MTLVRKSSPGAAGPHVWESEGDVIDVHPELAAMLLRMPDAGFSEVAGETPAVLNHGYSSSAGLVNTDRPASAPVVTRPATNPEADKTDQEDKPELKVLSDNARARQRRIVE